MKAARPRRAHDKDTGHTDREARRQKRAASQLRARRSEVRASWDTCPPRASLPRGRSTHPGLPLPPAGADGHQPGSSHAAPTCTSASWRPLPMRTPAAGGQGQRFKAVFDSEGCRTPEKCTWGRGAAVMRPAPPRALSAEGLAFYDGMCDMANPVTTPAAARAKAPGDCASLSETDRTTWDPQSRGVVSGGADPGWRSRQASVPPRKERGAPSGRAGRRLRGRTRGGRRGAGLEGGPGSRDWKSFSREAQLSQGTER